MAFALLSKEKYLKALKSEKLKDFKGSDIVYKKILIEEYKKLGGAFIEGSDDVI